MSKSKQLHISMTGNETRCGWIYLFFEVFVLPSLLVMLNGILPVPVRPAILNSIYYLLNFIAILAIFHRFLLKSLASVGKQFWSFLQAAVLGFVAYWLCNTLLSRGILAIFPNFFNVNDAGIAAMAKKDLFLMAIGTVFLVPVVEECLFRGLIFHGLHGKNRFLAYSISALCFSAIHVMSYIGAYDRITLILCFLQYIPAGLWLAWSYAKSGTIFTPILIHAAVNAIGIYSLR